MCNLARLFEKTSDFPTANLPLAGQKDRCTVVLFSERRQILGTLAFVRRNHKIVKAEGIAACQSSYGDNFYA